MKPLLILSEGRTLGGMPLEADPAIEVRRVRALPDPATLDPNRAAVIVLDRTLVRAAGPDAAATLAGLAARAALIAVGDEDEREPAREFPAHLLTSFLSPDAPASAVAVQLRGAFRHAATIVDADRARYREERSRRELADLTRVGVALSTERDLTTLLEMILSQARRITWSDAASLYLVDRNADGTAATTLRFRLSQNHSLPDLPFSEFTVPIDHSSLAGHAAVTGEPMAIEDVYLLPDHVPYQQNRSFDDKFGYRTKSMLVLPMKTHRDEVIGVLQLINRKRRFDVTLSSPAVGEREVLAYEPHDLELVSALAAQAGVAIENSLLYEDIEKLFEGFVTAAVTAIESRDPTTSGHSGRVATLTVGLAEAVNRGGAGRYKGLRFSAEQIREIRYAGLLHDFGKVGVREQVLVKQKKLYGADLDLIRHRFAFLLQRADLQFERERANYLLEYGTAMYDQAVVRLNEARRAKRAELERFLDAIVKANEPTIMPEGTFDELYEINQRAYLDFDGEQRPLLHDDELQFLMIRKGNLDERERREIESHVTHTYRFLGQIPWTRELAGIPAIAYGHHEKLDGRGYPRQVKGDAIPVQTRMMTISDIFDALTATDRPYKRAVSHARALDILSMEAKEGMLDGELLGTFIEAGVFRAVEKANETAGMAGTDT
ncbi:MAG TPA: HD domain-containing phosphohydrolase [Gemmatimonadaceae bacterium]|nr:HD domain-containing phosphohydrolase [Gemmatimonadaceae bacterium]